MKHVVFGMAMMTALGMASCAQKPAQQQEDAAVGEMAIQTFKK